MGIEEQVMVMLKQKYQYDAWEQRREEFFMTLKGKTASKISRLLEVEEALIVSMQKSMKPG